MPDREPHSDSNIINPNIKTAVLETADVNACPIAVCGNWSIAYDNMALSGLIPNNCPMYIVGVIIIAVPDITHCNVVKAH